ncbi:MAG: polyprenyl synthetase family protein [Paludibacteraceae bacterium]
MEKLTLIRQPIEREFLLYEQLYEATLRSENPLLNEVLTHTALHRGKQLRPLLTLLAAKICNPVTEKTLQAAVALELLHTATLMHDDVVDNSPVRRGAPSVQAQWTNKVAVLVGDYLLAKVIGITADIHHGKILSIIAQLGQMLSSGELLQLHAGGTMWITEEQYFKIIDQKTAQLFQACMEAGAESAGCTQRQRTALREFGRLFGLCFQIKDDIFDYSDSEEIGKPTMNDIRDGKVTLPLIVSLQRAPQQEADRVRMLAEALANHDEKVDAAKVEEEIKSFVMRYQGILYAQHKMEQLRAQAVELLAIFRDPIYSQEVAIQHPSPKQSLIQLLNYAINRLY